MKASFKDEYQDETGVCEHKESSKGQYRMNPKTPGDYDEKVKVGYDMKAPHGGKSFVKGKPKQYGEG